MSLAGKLIERVAQSGAVRAVLGRTVSLMRLEPVDAGAPALAPFLDHLRGLTGTVLEIGTRRVDGAGPTARRDWARGAKYIGCDFRPGPDVDVVADVETLSGTFAPGSIDAVIACSVFEHVRRPWLAAIEIGKVLRPGGLAYVQTHATFPLHGHPFDYWRFSREALESLFSVEAGFAERQSWYDYPAMIVSGESPLQAVRPTFLNVNIVARAG